MIDTAIAIQPPKVQETAPQPSSNGVVNASSDKQKFDKVLKSMLNDGKAQLKDSKTQSKGEKELVQILEKNGEENAQELAAQLMVQNPMLIAMLLANTNVDGTSVEEALSQLTQGAQLTQGTQQVQGITADTMQEIITGATNTEATLQQPIAIAGELFSTTILQVAQNQQAAQNQPATQNQQPVQPQEAQVQAAQPQAAQQEQALQDIAATPQQSEGMAELAKGLNANVVSPQPTTQKEQPQQLAQKAEFDSIAQKVKLETAKPQQDTQQDATHNGSERSKQAKEQKLTDGGVKQPSEQAMPADFSKQINEIKPVKEAEATVKNQGSQEVIRQTVEGIKQNISKGKEEFVMKLTPEGLGEITVRLVSENGHTTMQLTAQNQSIQRILGSELEALQQAVRPYNVEVKEVTTANQSQLDMNMSNQNNPQQQYQSSAAGFFYNQQQGGKGQPQQSYFLRNQMADIPDNDSAIIPQAVHGTAMNIHI